MNDYPLETNHPLDPEKEEKPSSTCCGLTRQELHKMKILTQSSILFFLFYIIIGLYLLSLFGISTINPKWPKLLNISTKVLTQVMIPVFTTNCLGKLLTFYSASSVSPLFMRLSSCTQLIAISLDIYFFIKVIREGKLSQTVC